jgi:glucoamylase
MSPFTFLSRCGNVWADGLMYDACVTWARKGIRPGSTHLSSIAKTGNAGYMLPEQVWDDFPPSGQSGFPRGEGTFSATPLAWTHAQFVRLAWSIEANRPVEQPSIVACGYTGRCTN